MRALRLLLALSLALAGASQPPEPVRPLTPSEFEVLASRCVPGAPLATLKAITRIESAFNPLALSVNYPQAASPALGLGPSGATLARQPATLPEALGWIRWLASRKLSVSIGLMQVSSENLGKLGITPEQAFESCVNLQTAWLLFRTHLKRAQAALGNGPAALHAALSDYNSGSLTVGYVNGYVERVLQTQLGMARAAAYLPQRPGQPIVTNPQSGDNAENDPNDAPTAVPWGKSTGWGEETHGEQAEGHQGRP